MALVAMQMLIFHLGRGTKTIHHPKLENIIFDLAAQIRASCFELQNVRKKNIGVNQISRAKPYRIIKFGKNLDDKNSLHEFAISGASTLIVWNLSSFFTWNIYIKLICLSL
jgi:hypothetical protein